MQTRNTLWQFRVHKSNKATTPFVLLKNSQAILKVFFVGLSFISVLPVLVFACALRLLIYHLGAIFSVSSISLVMLFAVNSHLAHFIQSSLFNCLVVFFDTSIFFRLASLNMIVFVFIMISI